MPECTNTALRRAARQLGNLYDEAVAPIGLKATQFGLLSQIHGFGAEGPTLQTLAERMVIRISALTHALRPLVRDKLVELHLDPRDNRAKRAVLTHLGKKRLAEGEALWAAANRNVETVLGPSSATMLRNMADRISSGAFVDAYKARRPLKG